MRRAFLVLSLGVAGALAVGITGGCAHTHGQFCETDDCPSAEPTCDGTCVPYMDSTWDMALVGMALPDRTILRCPAVAPFAGMSGTEVPPSRSAAREVVACSVNPKPTCSSDTHVCVPFEPDFAPCIIQLGDQDCPDLAYPLKTEVQSSAGHPVTVCCEEPQEAE